MPAPRRDDIRWGWIEEQYRLGQLSTRAIADAHSTQYGVKITESYIRKRAKAHGWERDLSSEIQRRVRRKVAELSVGAQVDASEPLGKPKRVKRAGISSEQAQILQLGEKRDQAIIELTAEIATKKVEEHRKYAERLHELANRLEAHIVEQLPVEPDGSASRVLIPRAVSDLADLLKESEVVTDDVVNALLATSYGPNDVKAIASAVASAAQTRAKAIEIERKAYSLEDNPDNRGGNRGTSLELLREFLSA